MTNCSVMNRVAATLMLAVCVFVAGCGANGEPYQPRPVRVSKSVIYIYRTYTVLSSEAAPMVTCGHESIELLPGGYYSIVEEPGPVTCSASGAVQKFEAHPGEEYFIKEDVASALAGGR
ncbi:MAG TPA: hypothetical protein VEU51_16200, partial [Candidatus Acidoferrales bacterium]|nr:hypothetical protein [Candidatus Acidoferrales bacterium]